MKPRSDTPRLYFTRNHDEAAAKQRVRNIVVKREKQYLIVGMEEKDVSRTV